MEKLQWKKNLLSMPLLLNIMCTSSISLYSKLSEKSLGITKGMLTKKNKMALMLLYSILD